jgi:hypothetical protein
MPSCRTEIRELTEERNMKANAAETLSADRGKRASSELFASFSLESSASQVATGISDSADKIQANAVGKLLHFDFILNPFRFH